MKKKYRVLILIFLFFQIFIPTRTNIMEKELSGMSLPLCADETITLHENILIHDENDYLLSWEINDTTYELDAFITIQINSQLVFSSGFQSYLEYNMTILEEGSYEIIFTYNDGMGNIEYDTFMLYNNYSPQIIPHKDLINLIYTEKEIISWNVIDNSYNQPSYTIKIDSDLVFEGNDPNLIEHEFFMLSLGMHEISFYYEDGFGKNVSENFTVCSNDIPEINSNFEVNFVDLDENDHIVWNIEDSIQFNPNYSIYIDGNPMIENESLIDNLVYYVLPSLSVGRYDLDLKIDDGRGVISSNTLVLISGKVDFITHYDSFVITHSKTTQNEIVFAIKNNVMNEGFFEVYIDNLLFISKQAYITSISVNISSVSFQDHNLFILVESVSNLVDYNYFPLSINSDPIFVLEPSQNNFDSNNFNLTWKILDDTKYYESRLVVYLDDELYDTIYYEGNDEFVVEFSAINNGNHSILVIFYDGFGRNVSSSIEINVESKDDDLNLGLIIGLSIGGIVIIGGIIVVSIIIKKKKKK